MKRRDFITKGIAAGATLGASHSLLANTEYVDLAENDISTGSGMPVTSQNQDLSVFWEDLTAPDFRTAVDKAAGVCIILSVFTKSTGLTYL